MYPQAAQPRNARRSDNTDTDTEREKRRIVQLSKLPRVYISTNLTGNLKVTIC